MSELKSLARSEFLIDVLRRLGRNISKADLFAEFQRAWQFVLHPTINQQLVPADCTSESALYKHWVPFKKDAHGNAIQQFKAAKKRNGIPDDQSVLALYKQFVCLVVGSHVIMERRTADLANEFSEQLPKLRQGYQLVCHADQKRVDDGLKLVLLREQG